MLFRIILILFVQVNVLFPKDTASVIMCHYDDYVVRSYVSDKKINMHVVEFKNENLWVCLMEWVMKNNVHENGMYYVDSDGWIYRKNCMTVVVFSKDFDCDVFLEFKKLSKKDT